MNTRFAHLNPDRRKASTMSEGEETVVSEDSSSVSDAQISKMALEIKKEEARAAEEHRRALEVQLELAKFQASNKGVSLEQNATALERSDSRAEFCRYSKWLSGVLPKFPAEAEVPVWFESIEHTLEAYAVPKEQWGQIVFPLIVDKVRFLSTRLTPSQHKEYEVLKKVVLEELKLSAGEYRRRFITSKKLPNESWRAFATRLQSYLNFYVEERGVKTLEGIVELLVADQLKNTLSEDALRYVTLQEGEGWKKAQRWRHYCRRSRKRRERTAQ